MAAMSTSKANYSYSLKYLNGRRYELKHIAENPRWNANPRTESRFIVVKGAGIYYLLRDFVDSMVVGDETRIVPPHHNGVNQLYLDFRVEQVFIPQRIAQYGVEITPP